MITAGQLRASRALLGIDQRKLAEVAGLSLPTIQRMEASEGVIRGNVDSLMKLIAAARPALARRAFPLDALAFLPRRGQSRRARCASLYALGYGRHETAPQRVLPFYPAFLAGMNLVVLADDAFTFCCPGSSCRSRPGRW
jgi:transcriptional regulator with XRE-family HTH domain